MGTEDVQIVYGKLFGTLVDGDLFADGPVLWTASTQEELNSPTTQKALNDLINDAGGELPGIYHENYVAPLLRNLKWTSMRCRPGTIQTLAGAIYDHGRKSKVRDELRPFLAVISNLYRSFIEPEPSAKSDFPEPEVKIPPLATFRPKLNVAENDFGPVTLPADEVERLCGGKVGVVVLPSCYRSHPVICWACVAHEAGGHDVLHAYPGVLRQMREKVRTIFYAAPYPKNLNDPEVLWGLLWQYWLDEAAADVCAVMNLGPSYGLALAVFMAALNERISRYFLERVKADMQNQLRRARDEQTRMQLREQIQKLNTTLENVKKSPRLTVSWPPPEFEKLSHVNSHPTDILKIYVVMGAIKSLPLDQTIKDYYIDRIETCIKLCLDEDKNPEIVIHGSFEFKPGHWISIDSQNPLRGKLKDVKEKAEEVGRAIADDPYPAFNGNRLQDLETWDRSDEDKAKAIMEILKDSSKVKEENVVVDLGDDAQLLSGALLALFEVPELYGDINKRLHEALNASFDSDPIWGPASWHPFANGSSESDRAITIPRTSNRRSRYSRKYKHR